MRLFTSAGMPPCVMTGAVSFGLATLGNSTLWAALWGLPELHNAKGYAFLLCFCMAIAAFIAALAALLTSRFTHKPVLIVLLHIAAVCTYFMWTYGVVIDRSMIVNALQTDTKESLELMSWRMLACVLLLATLPSVWVWRSAVAYAPWLRQLRNNFACGLLAMICAVALLLGNFQTVSSTMRNHTQLRHLITPLNALNGLAGTLSKSGAMAAQTAAPIGIDATLDSHYATQSKPPLLVLVVGETARYDHFGINGYARDTTPKLSARSDIISAKNAWSCGTNTAASVPCMFSHLGKTAYEDNNQRFESLLDVLQRAGLAVLWIDNQAGCKGVCDGVSNINTSRLTLPDYCATGECRDGVMLTVIDEAIAKLPATARAKGVVVVMHQMGSHGPAYYARTDHAFKKFLPECASNALNTCELTHVVNAYDNTIAYTDDFLARTIGWLEAKTATHHAAMMYVSDHGESLGENNIFLHGLPYRIAPDTQKRVPWITWFSPDFAQRTQLDTACALRGKDDMRSHDHYFHTVLGLMNVKTSLYSAELDVYAACKK